VRAAAVPDVSGPALPFPRPSPAHCIFLHFFLDNSSLHANLLRVTTRLIGPGGGTKAGFPTSRSFGFSGGAPPLHHSIPPWISIRQPDDSSKVQFHLIPLNSTWFHLVPLNSTSRWGGGGGRRSQIHQILIHLYRAQHRSQEKNAFCSADSRVPLRQSAIRNPQSAISQWSPIALFLWRLLRKNRLWRAFCAFSPQINGSAYPRTIYAPRAAFPIKPNQA